jgi:AcrR family transcriptional regulator
MPPSPPRARAASTREALFRAGLRRFAAEGWQAARVRDIVADAGQANDSAVNYHFGSRRGLLEEILARGVARQEPERRADLLRWGSAPPDLPEVVRAVVAPLADLLDDDEGRSILRVIAQVGALAEVGETVSTGPVAGTALQDQLAALVAETARHCGGETARQRVRRLIVMLTAELASRAADLDADPGRRPPHPEYVADLVAGFAASLERPAPGVND